MDPAIWKLTLGSAAVAGLLLVVGVWRQRGSNRSELRAQLAEWRRSGLYWGVRVAARGEPGCEAMQRVAAHVFPITSAPPLPLPDCSRRRCRCHYRPYPERRRSERRERHDRRGAIRLDNESIERRRGGDRRRASDPWQGRPL